jgi:pyridoxine 5-phosphate synthase
VALFVDPVLRQVRASGETGAEAIEINTGRYAESRGARAEREMEKIGRAAALAAEEGLRVHAGHGLNYHNVFSVADVPEIEELNIGHSIVSRAVFVGMETAVRQMRELLP